MNRQAPPTLPNFPSASEPRSPPPADPLSPSPAQSPTASSPFRSPGRPSPARRSSSGFSLPLQQPNPLASANTGFSSPWAALAASSGAPTPSIEGPMGRNSPHLRSPFERLNIDGGGNSSSNMLRDESPRIQFGESLASPFEGQFRHSASAASLPLSNKQMPTGTGPPVRGGLSAETLMRYKAIATGAGKSDIGGESAPLAAARKKNSLLTKHSSTTLGSSTPHSTKSPSPLASSVSGSQSPGGMKPQMIAPVDLAKLLPNSTTLVLDVRPPSSFQSSHIPSSHSLPIPSTLLRRPAFTLDKLTQMLSPHSMQEVSKWQEKSDIVLVDADSGSVPDGGVLDGLAGKFGREGYSGRLWFVKGGHAAMKLSGVLALVSDDDEEPQPQQGAAGVGAQKGLMAESTTGGKSSGRQPPPKGLTIPPTPSLNFQSNPFGSSFPMTTAISERPTALRRLGDAPATTNSIADPTQAKFQPANPFFDNIRQNLELSHGGITERIPLNLPESVKERADQFPDWLRDLVTMPEQDSMDKLAHQFYQLELHEQKRLQAIMEWHTKGSGALLQPDVGYEGRTSRGASEKKNWEWAIQRESDMEELKRLMNWDQGIKDIEYFPFSITAGVERGTKNRYKNIWPYDFSRVRLNSPPDKDSDYINASYIQPRGTSRRYIATQGPLDATYRDFWTLVWEQNVRIIVMITKQFEGGLIKCGNYWGEERYGHIKLQLVSQSGGEDNALPAANSGFDFGTAGATPKSSTFPQGSDSNIKRVFLVSRDDKPDQPPRKVVQFQCIGWPDFDVPEKPDTLLKLIQEVNDAACEARPAGCYRKADEPPVLVHCSAGVGRTGSFIVVDAILDGLRRDLCQRSAAEAQSVDEPACVPEAISPQHSSSAPPVTTLSTVASTEPVCQSFNLVDPNGSVAPQFSTSPGTMPTQPEHHVAPNLSFPSKERSGDETMEVDPLKAANSVDHRFMQYRMASVGTSVSSGSDTRRPSLASAQTSSDRISSESIPGRLSDPQLITSSNRRRREPSPLSAMRDPVSCVLEGMRVQRMSLVQTLRQYLFVHRAIIYHYLHMLDHDQAKERPNPSPLQKHAPSFGSSVSGSAIGSLGSLGSFGSIPTTNSASGGSYTDSLSTNSHGDLTKGSTDEDSHTKRRASPTELHPDVVLGGEGGSELSKRPSFKKMKPGTTSGRMGRKSSAMWKGMEKEAVAEEAVVEELKD
ncbi:protein-tyrosine-phosphatase [Cryptococcus bacillisporus CA1873]|uniref:protein-tyrosine-phosphatase n=1 Tax=Cryptococcus bacillisporus CA1873 TaxID=1296111 RepID=A0ABR5B7Z4_CRYGA|nr:protein-tyrosine-phosphatase [Cryptococcus bacillisporus CA1873]|eukprot:KIR59658.1 protein-tyrosine-phosphatase [Cryptococcus gattii CA1873]